MQTVVKPALRWVLALILLLILAISIWQWGILQSQWNQWMLSIMRTQASLHQQLTHAIKFVAQHGWQASGSLISLSLIYGVFHAAGPGHGKAVITTYLGTSRTRLRRGLLLSLLSSLTQGVVAIVLVEAVVGVLGYSLRQTQSKAGQLENLSFALVALLGLLLALRSGLAIYQRWRSPPPKQVALFSGAKHKMGKSGYHSYCVECGGPHSITQHQLEQPLHWRTAIPIILAIGLRPCTGAILVLLLSYSLNLRWAGMAAVLAMSLGTAATVSALAIAAVSFRQGLLRFFRTRRAHISPLIFDVLGVAGGMLLLLMGLDLLRRGLVMTPHPLL